jgi:hypothetical protein
MPGGTPWGQAQNYVFSIGNFYIAPFKVKGQSHIILQQLSCGTRSKVSFVSPSIVVEKNVHICSMWVKTN